MCPTSLIAKLPDLFAVRVYRRSHMLSTLIHKTSAQMKLYGEDGESESRGHVSVMMVGRPKE